MRKVEQFELMRRDFEREGLSVRAIAGKYGVHRRKVREAIELSVPPERKVPERWTFYIDKDGTIKAIDKGVQKRTKEAGADLASKIKELGLAGE